MLVWYFCFCLFCRLQFLGLIKVPIFVPIVVIKSDKFSSPLLIYFLAMGHCMILSVGGGL